MNRFILRAALAVLVSGSLWRAAPGQAQQTSSGVGECQFCNWYYWGEEEDPNAYVEFVCEIIDYMDPEQIGSTHCVVSPFNEGCTEDTPCRTFLEFALDGTALQDDTEKTAFYRESPEYAKTLTCSGAIAKRVFAPSAEQRLRSETDRITL